MSNIKQQKKDKKKRKISIYSIILLLIVVIGIIYGIYVLSKHLYYYTKYSEYEEKMIQYGLDDLYNNGSAKSSEKVTNSEMIKVIIGSISGVKDASGLVHIEGNKTYNNEDFVKYAELLKIINENSIYKQNENEVSNYVQAVEVSKKSVKTLLKEEYNEEIDSSDSDLNKGMLNKLVIQIVEKYSTLYRGNMLNAKIVTDKDKLPENYKEYPYIIDTIPNNVYEMDFEVLDKDRFMNPVKEYEKRGEVYYQIDTYLTQYFNTILNVNYETINEKEFFNSIKDILIYDYSQELVKDYVEYVKENKIKLEGSVQPLLPIIYNNGEENIIRAKIKFKVLNSNTDKNLLLPDIVNEENIKYEGKTFEFYADIPMGAMLNATSLRVKVQSLPNMILTEGIKILEIKEK